MLHETNFGNKNNHTVESNKGMPAGHRSFLEPHQFGFAPATCMDQDGQKAELTAPLITPTDTRKWEAWKRARNPQFVTCEL